MLLEDCQKLSQQAKDVVALKKYATELDKFRDSLQNKVSSLKTEIEDQLRQAWMVYKRHQIPMTNSDLLEVRSWLAEQGITRFFYIRLTG